MKNQPYRLTMPVLILICRILGSAMAVDDVLLSSCGEVQVNVWTLWKPVMTSCSQRNRCFGVDYRAFGSEWQVQQENTVETELIWSFWLYLIKFVLQLHLYQWWRKYSHFLLEGGVSDTLLYSLYYPIYNRCINVYAAFSCCSYAGVHCYDLLYIFLVV